MLCAAFDAAADLENLVGNKLRHRARKFGQLDALFDLGFCFVVSLAVLLRHK